ncbi:MAG: hypothetical protein K9W43_02885 [Candidatus Thorarchaeota archaeon]|nr:hypothetical protein [Candidatus Thorarchaeota archaeon]
MNDSGAEPDRTTLLKIIKSEARKKSVELLCEFATRPTSMHAILRQYLAEEKPTVDLFMMVQALTMSTIRFLNTIDFLISRSKLQAHFKSLPDPEKNALRLAVYEGRWLRTPIAILEDQYLAKYDHLRRALRRAIGMDLARAVSSLEDPERLGIEFSHPSFLVKTFIDKLGRDDAIQLMQVNLQPRPYYIRPNLLKCNESEMVEALHEANIKVESDPEVTGIYKVIEGADRIIRSSLFRKGNVLVQDKASVLTVRSLDARPGDTVWDACAAPGMKTQLLWESMHKQGHLAASDIHLGRLKMAADRIGALGCSEVSWILADASTVPVRNADKILIDAPCTSTGILRSRPSFKWKLNKRYLMSIMSIQHKILEGIMSVYVNRPSTEIVYATCSLLPHEGEDQIDSMLSRYDVEFLEIPIPNASHGYPEYTCTDKVRRLFPHIHNTSGFFIAKFRIV